jgi:general secretion pathway protein D
MRTSALSVLILLAGSIAASASAQSARVAEAAPERGVPLAQLLESVAKRSGKKMIVDPRVQGEIQLFGQDPSRVDYEELLMILNINGMAALEEGGYVRVTPDASIRVTALPIVTGNESLPLAQYVTTIIRVKSVPPVFLVPILRPMLPQAGHLAALPCKNALIMVDTLANVRRIKALIESLDTGEPVAPEKCEYRPAAANGQVPSSTPSGAPR